MSRTFEMEWEGELEGSPEAVWDAVTRQAAAYLWPIEYEPRVGGAERGLTGGGGTVTVWEPPRRFVTRGERANGAPNQLEYVLEPRDTGTWLRYVHHGAVGADEDYDREVAACRHHTDFYNHSLGEYVRHFSGREATYVAADAPAASASGGFARVLTALGLREGVAAGDRVQLAVPGSALITGTVDYATNAFLGVRTADALFRVYGRDAWGWPVGVAHHLFAPGADGAVAAAAWTAWLAELFADVDATAPAIEAVA